MLTNMTSIYRELLQLQFRVYQWLQFVHLNGVLVPVYKSIASGNALITRSNPDFVANLLIYKR